MGASEGEKCEYERQETGEEQKNRSRFLWAQPELDY